MIYKISDSGIFFPLLEAVNTVKAGTNTVLTIKYFYDEDSLQNISSRTLSLEHFKVDIENSLFQWEDFISNLYSNKVHFKGSLTVKFELSSVESADLIFKCSTSGPKIKVDTKNIIFNSTASWGSSLIPNVDDVLRYAVYGVGQFLGLSNQLGDTPMSSITLNKSFHLSNGLSPDRNGLITEPVLHKYKLLTPHFKKIFGSTATSVARVYGCTNSNASNYNPLANTNDGSCINIDDTVISTSSNRYTPTRMSSNTPHQIIALNGDGAYYKYTKDGIVPLESPYSTPPQLLSSVGGLVLYQANSTVVLSLEGDKILNLTAGLLGIDAPYTTNRVTIVSDRLGNYITTINELYGHNNSLGSYYTQSVRKEGESLKLDIFMFGVNSLGSLIDLSSTPSDYEDIDCDNSVDAFGMNLGNIGGYGIATMGNIFSGKGEKLADTSTRINGFYNFGPINEYGTAGGISDATSFDMTDPDTFSDSHVFGRDSFVSSVLHLPEGAAETEFPFSLLKSYPEVKHIYISPFQDSYVVCRGPFVPEDEEVRMWGEPLTPGYAEQDKDFYLNSDIKAIVYPMATSGNFSFTGDNATESMGLINLSSRKWQKSTQSFEGTSDFEKSLTYFEYTQYLAGESVPDNYTTDAIFRDLAVVYADYTGGESIGTSFQASTLNSDRISRLKGRYKLVISKRLREGGTFYRTFVEDNFVNADPSDYLEEGVVYTYENPYEIDILMSSVIPGVGLGIKYAILMVEYGWLLLTMDNLSGRLTGVANGHELHIPAGDNSLLGYNDEEFTEGGFRMIDIAISPMDNFVYAIVEHPESGDRHIVVYKLGTSVDSILEDARSIPNPFDGELSSVQVGADGFLYFYSKGSSDYIMVPSPDLQWSVDVLLYFTEFFTKSLEGVIDFVPGKPVIDLLKKGTEDGVFLNYLDEGFEDAQWNDVSIEYQLNLADDVEITDSIPIGDQEQFIIGVDDQDNKIAVDINNIGDLANVVDGEILVDTIAPNMPDGEASHERLLSVQGSILARVSLIDSQIVVTYLVGGVREGEVLDGVNKLISVESFSYPESFFYNIIYTKNITAGEEGVYKLKLLYNHYSDGAVSLDSTSGTLNETLLYTMPTESYIDSCIVNSGVSNMTTIYVATQDAGVITYTKLEITGDDFTESEEGTLNEVDLLGQLGAAMGSFIYNYDDSILKFRHDGQSPFLMLTLSILPPSSILNMNELDDAGITIGSTVFEYNITTRALTKVLSVEAASVNYNKNNPKKIVALEPALASNTFILIGDKYETLSLKYFGANSQSLSHVEILPSDALEGFSSDFAQDDAGLYTYDGSQDIKAAENLISLPNGRIYIETNSGESISRIYGPTSISPYYAINIAPDNNIEPGFGPIMYNIKGEIGGMSQQGPTPDDNVTVAIPGCMNINACNYNEYATIDDNSCLIPDDADIINRCDGGCDGAIPYIGITNCGTCYTGEAFQDTDCYVCPEGTDLGNGNTATGCEGIEDPCYPDYSACTIYGCFDSQVLVQPCNAVENSGVPEGSDLYPDEHLGELCIFPTNGCECDGSEGLTPSAVAEGDINCTDCDNDPGTTIIKDNTYCDCDRWARHDSGTLNPSDKIYLLNTYGVCDCVGTPVEEGCDCYGTVIDSTAFCDCGVPTDNEGEPYCDCNQESILQPGKECYDDNGELLCNHQAEVHYFDGDGDGFYNPEILQLMCPNAVTAAGNGDGGYPLWTTIEDSLGIDGCDGFQDECNLDCISYDSDGNLTGEIRILDDCNNCYYPSDGEPIYECECGDLPDGFCDCGVEDLGCGCLNGEAIIPHTTGTGEGEICAECTNNPDGTPKLWDACNNCGVEAGTYTFVESTGFYTNDQGSTKCTCSGEIEPNEDGCCTGYVFDTCVNSCVLAGTATELDCAGGCDGLVNDACGFCDGPYDEVPSGTEEGEDCGCPDTIDGTPPTADCGGNCPGTLVADGCGVCDGDNSDCTGCTDAEAFNYDNTATIGCEDCCEYYNIINPDAYPLIDDGGTLVSSGNMASVITHHSDVEIQHYGDIVGPNNPTIVTEYQLGVDGNTTNVTRDNPIFTSKCQVISASNPILILDRAIDNAEITYSYTPTLGGVDLITGVSTQNPESISSNDVATASGKTVNFYFRLEGDLNTTVSNIANNFFGPYMSSNIQSVSKEDGSAEVLESELVEGTPEITATVIHPNGTFEPVSATYSNYHVYKVTMRLDADGTISEIPEGVDLSALFAAQENAVNTDIYICDVCPEGETQNGAVYTQYPEITSADMISIASGNPLVVINQEGTATTPPLTTTYTIAANCACTDDCLLNGNDYAQVCGNSDAINYTPELGECQEYGDDNFCSFPEEPTPYCSDPNYLEFHEVDTNEGLWEIDDSLCLNLLQIEETETDTTQGTYTITTDYTGDALPDVEYIIYTKAGKIIQDESEVRHVITSSGTKRTIQTIRSVGDCAGFVPIAFNTNNEWLKGKFTISKNDTILWQLDYGSLDTQTFGSSIIPDGSAILKLGTTDCTAGCDATTISVTGCTRSVEKDVKEFTDFTVEILTEESPTDSYDETSFILYNITTGERLVDLIGGIGNGEVRVENFKLSDTTVLGVKAISKNMLIYRIIDEQGKILKTKSLYNDSYFEPFTLELLEPGCTDSEAANYNENAGIDNGTCIDAALYDCVKDALLNIDTLQCDSRESTKALQIYTVYQSYKESLKEKNSVKIEMYKEKLADLCNCKTC